MPTDDTGMHVRPLPRIGQELGRFIIERELPRGGQARVYRAWQTDLQRPVALKLLPSSYVAEGEVLTRFRREIENVARINHPNIVRVFEAGELLGNPFFTMDYIEGNDAETILKRGPFDPDEAAAVMEAIARAVAEAHGQGIIHRDIKPGNIIVRRDGTPVLTDFGLAQDLGHSEQLTQTGISMGTPAYMAPEQARGERNRVGVKSDIYSLGATLYTLLTAKRPAEGDSAYELMLKVAENEGPEWPRYAVESVPPDLRAIVEMAMAPDPAKRYESAAAFADDLERYLHGEWVVARSRGKLAKLWLRTRRYVPVAAVVMIALGLAGGMVYTGLNPAFSDNSDFIPYGPQSEILGDDPTDEEIRELFERGAWTQRGGTVMRGPGGELVLSRSGDDALFISPRERACWGDFTLQSELRVRGMDGPLELLIGMTDSEAASESAYSVVLGAGSRDRGELRRLGVTVLSTDRPDRQPILTDGAWYRAVFERSGQTVRFTLFQVGAPAPSLALSFDDIYPAFAGDGRERMALRGDIGELSLRGVAVSHRRSQQAEEALLYSVGQYSQVDYRITARLATPLPPDADTEVREERAALLFLRARCRERIGMLDEAIADCDEAKKYIMFDANLRTRVYLFGSMLQTAAGNDDAAIVQLNSARLQSPSRELASWVQHNAATRAAMLEASETPQRALRYYDFVSQSALGNPGLVCEALWRDAQLRLRLAEGDPEQGAELRARALENLQRIEGATYERFGSVYAPAMVRLFELLRADADTPADRIAETAAAMAASVNGYGVRDDVLVEPLGWASWYARLQGGPEDLTLARSGSVWVEAARRAGGDEAWVLTHLALAAEERPELFGNTEGRAAMWREVRPALRLDEPSHAVPAAIVEFFLGTPVDAEDSQRREDNLRRAIRLSHADAPAHWIGGAGPDAFADYCIALATATNNEDRAVFLLQRAATSASPGELRMLAGREKAWLPVRR